MAAAPRVVIIGGGFGGLDAARALSRAPVRITLVDRHNYHLFQPLLYQVATASLSPGDIASPIRWVLRRQQNVEVLLAHALAIDPAAKTVALDRGDALSYDYLILATGAAHAYFGHDEWATRAPGLKTLDDALEMRRRMLLAFEDAERETDPAAQRRLLTFVIIGGGPTGVELAGALAEIARQSLTARFPPHPPRVGSHPPPRRRRLPARHVPAEAACRGARVVDAARRRGADRGEGHERRRQRRAGRRRAHRGADGAVGGRRRGVAARALVGRSARSRRARPG